MARTQSTAPITPSVHLGYARQGTNELVPLHQELLAQPPFAFHLEPMFICIDVEGECEKKATSELNHY